MTTKPSTSYFHNHFFITSNQSVQAKQKRPKCHHHPCICICMQGEKENERGYLLSVSSSGYLSTTLMISKHTSPMQSIFFSPIFLSFDETQCELWIVQDSGRAWVVFGLWTLFTASSSFKNDSIWLPREIPIGSEHNRKQISGLHETGLVVLFLSLFLLAK